MEPGQRLRIRYIAMTAIEAAPQIGGVYRKYDIGMLWHAAEYPDDPVTFAEKYVHSGDLWIAMVGPCP